MLDQDYTAKLLDLEDVIITKIENCVHDYRMQTVKDVPLARDTFLHFRKRRYRCACGKRFFEENAFLPRYHRVTGRLVCAVIQAFQTLVSAKEIAHRYKISGTTAMRYFNLFNTTPQELPEVLSIDEFKGNSGGEKYNCILVDPENKKVLDILPDRYENQLVQYFKQFDNKNDVKYFVCDMNPHFRNVAKTCFPQAKIVADRYHVIRQVYWDMERTRKNEQENLPDRLRKYFKKSRCLLMKPMGKLTEEEMDRLALMFEIAPRLADAYRLKNEFLTAIRSESSAVGRERLKDWLFLVELMELQEFRNSVRACCNWFREIRNSMDVPWTNGFVEGCNNKTKVLKKVCFGMRNFSNFRKRILFANT